MKKIQELTQEEKDINMIMSTEHGRNFVYSIIRRSQCDLLVNPNDLDPIKVAFNAGLNQIGKWLKNTIMDADFNNYLQMLRESKKDG